MKYIPMIDYEDAMRELSSVLHRASTIVRDASGNDAADAFEIAAKVFAQPLTGKRAVLLTRIIAPLVKAAITGK